MDRPGAFAYGDEPIGDADRREAEELREGLYRSEASPEQDTEAAVRHLLEQAQQLMARPRYQSAIALFDKVVKLVPNHPGALAGRAECYLRLHNLRHALDEAKLAARYADTPELVEAVRAIRDECVRAMSDPHLESARQALRARQFQRAVDLIEQISRLRADDPEFAEQRAYAHDRLRRSQPPAERRTGGPGRKLDHDELQRVLCWLTREELEEGDEALNRKRYGRAVEVLDRASRIDGRGVRAAFLGAIAVYQYVAADLESDFNDNRPPDLPAAEANLRRAVEMVEFAAADPQYREDCVTVRENVDRLARSVDELRARRAKAKPVNDCVRRFNGIAENYLGRSITYLQASNAKRSLAVLGGDVARLRPRYDARSEEARTLADLAKAIGELLGQLGHVI
jgi:tetratricopeptide (TPR) repeat protein